MRDVEFRSLASGKQRGNNDCQIGSKPAFPFLIENAIRSVLNEGGVTLDTVIESDYHLMTLSERTRMFEMISHDAFFKKQSPDYRLLKARFNPRNQYKVTTLYLGKVETYECFKYEGKFHTGRQLYIKDTYITEAVPLAALYRC